MFGSRRLKAVACLLLWSNVASAGLVNPHLRLRADATTTDAASTTAATGTTARATTATATTGTAARATTSAASGDRSDSSESATATAASEITSVLTSITAPTTTSSLNTTLFNSTIPAGQLPIQPTVTPAWGVAGIILLLSGVVYALVGVRKRWIQIPFATAYLGALGTTVLILYVMSLPITNAVQGAYLVAAVATGVILGSLALVFKEIAECLSCVLGGFSLGMWLMCLRAGGLIQSPSGGNTGFIVGFTVAAFAFYFSHYTRHYAMLVCIAFGGATAAVLGIDCFSRAGLKEFWAYVWNLNDNLFPLGTVTYPLTRGIKVELAAVIIIFLAGVISQMKLWHLVKERRAIRDKARAEDEERFAREEERAGRDIEAANARDREQWEAVYGDGTYITPTGPGTANGSRTGDSGVGDMDSEKGDNEKTLARSATNGASSESQAGDNEADNEAAKETIEMADIQPKGAAEIVMEHNAAGGAVTVRVAQDEYPEGPPMSELPANNEHAPTPPQVSAPQFVTAVPGIVPLPFAIPGTAGEGDGHNDREDDDRSSVATFADEDEVIATRQPPSPQTPSGLAKRLSQGSVDLLRSISQRSKRNSTNLDGAVAGESKEVLVMRRRPDVMTLRQVGGPAKKAAEDDDNSSLAVTMDGLSSNGDAAEAEEAEAAKEIELTAKLASDAGTSSLKLPRVEASEASESPEAPEKRLSVDKSAVSTAPSTPANLTKDRLPQSLSRVAMSYRTNEWAKHLSHADAPEFETLQLGEPLTTLTQPSSRGVSPSPSPVVGISPGNLNNANNANNATLAPADGETAAPVNVAELQQTAETGGPAPAAPRSSMYGALGTSASRQSLMSVQSLTVDTGSANTGALPLATRNSFSGTPSGALNNGWRSMSANQLGARTSGLVHDAIAEEDANAVANNTPTPVSPTGSQTQRSSLPPVPGVVSFNTPQTLIGQRDMLLRSKSQQGLYIGGSVVRSASMGGLHNSFTGSTPHLAPIASGASDAGSVYKSVYDGADLDDLPMRQRKEMMRNSSLMSLNGPAPASPQTAPLSGAVPANTVPFDSHQPKRGEMHLPTAAARQAQLATFRNSIAADLRGGMGNTPTTVAATPGRVRESMSSPYLQQQQQGSTARLNQYASMASLQNVAGYQPTSGQQAQAQIDAQRQFLISQKEAEAQRREAARQEKELAERAFEERMRRGDLLDAHRDAMRKMQASAK